MKSARLWIFVAAVIIRLLLLPAPGFPTDIATFAAWMHALPETGLRGIYADTSNLRYPAVDYAPGYLYVLWLTGGIEHLLFGAQPSEFIDRVFVKLPACIADFALGFAVTAVAERFFGAKAATRVLAVLLLSPVLWLVSAYWGQVDVVAAVFFVLALRAAIDERFILMWLGVAAAILLKPQPVAALPLLAVYQLTRSRKPLALIAGPLAAIALAYLCAAPAAPVRNPVAVLHWLFERYTFGVAKYPNGSSGAFNLYTIIGNAYQPDTLKFGPLALHTLGSVAAVVAIASVAAVFAMGLRRISQRPQDPRESAIALIYGAALAVLALFLFMTRMHERYEMGAIVLLPLIALTGANRSKAAWVLGFDFVANCCAILAGFYGGHHHPQIVIVVHALSLLNVAAFLVLFAEYMRWCDRGNTTREIGGAHV